MLLIAGAVSIVPIVIGFVVLKSVGGGSSGAGIPDVASFKVKQEIFPQRPMFQPSFPSGVQLARARLTGRGPGEQTQMNIYLPAGEHAAKSTPCVLVAPAGTPLLHGSSLDGGDYHDETLPYSEAGFVVVHYSIDGAIPDSVNMNNEQAYTKAMSAAFPLFKNSGGGIVNGRNALEYALAKIDIVDPRRICAAGHSSAGTLALMLAASEPRVTHCAAYAAAVDVETRMAELIADPVSKLLFSGVEPFLHWYSPINHIDDFRCKMLVFHSRDDDNVPFVDATRFVGLIKDQGTNVTFVQTNQGGHYTPMITEGIPAAIQWLSEQK